MAYGQMGAITRRKWEPNLSEETLRNAPNAYYAAQIRDTRALQDRANAQQQEQFNRSMSLQREAVEQQHADAKRGMGVNLLAAGLSSPKLLDKIFSKSDTASAITTDAAKTAQGSVASKAVDGLARTTSGATGFFDTIKSGATDMFGENVASGISMSGLGKAGIGAAAGYFFGDNNLERAAIGAGVPLAINLGTALWEGSSLLDAASSSILPSLGGALGSIGLDWIF